VAVCQNVYQTWSDRGPKQTIDRKLAQPSLGSKRNRFGNGVSIWGKAFSRYWLIYPTVMWRCGFIP
jgi:hypothetical protein